MRTRRPRGNGARHTDERAWAATQGCSLKIQFRPAVVSDAEARRPRAVIDHAAEPAMMSTQRVRNSDEAAGHMRRSCRTPAARPGAGARA